MSTIATFHLLAAQNGGAWCERRRSDNAAGFRSGSDLVPVGCRSGSDGVPGKRGVPYTNAPKVRGGWFWTGLLHLSEHRSHQLQRGCRWQQEAACPTHKISSRCERQCRLPLLSASKLRRSVVMSRFCCFRLARFNTKREQINPPGCSGGTPLPSTSNPGCHCRREDFAVGGETGVGGASPHRPRQRGQQHLSGTAAMAFLVPECPKVPVG